MPTLRLALWNVHGWSDALHQPNQTRVEQELRDLDADVVCLNEAPGERNARALAEALGMQYELAAVDFSANLVLSREPLAERERVLLGSGGFERRVALVVKLGGAHEGLTLCCTHLDHRREERRLEQGKDLLRALLARAGPGLNLLLAGDLNALRLADYPLEVLEELRAHRASQHWELPQGAFVEVLDGGGWVDALRLARHPAGAPYDPAYPSPLAARDRSTCWAGTRVDYLFLEPGFARRVRSAHARVGASRASDHQPQLFALEY